MHWACRYIGKKWVSGARGPDTFDCWGLLWWIYKEHLGIELPSYPNVDPLDTFVVSHLLRQAAGNGQWHRLESPLDNCAVAMSRNREFHHVGIYLEVDGGMVLHAADGANVIAQTSNGLKAAGFNRLEYFRYGAHC